MEKNLRIRPGSIVQLLNCKTIRYRNCFLVVDKTFEWGVSGYVYDPVLKAEVPPTEISLRANWEEFVFVAKPVDLEAS